MRSIIEFDLNEPDDIVSFKRHMKANDMAFMLHELLRNTKKGMLYSLENKDIDKYDAVELVFEKIFELINEYNINIDDIL